MAQLQSDSYYNALEKRTKKQTINSTVAEVTPRWFPPEADWIKLNTDGVSKGNPGCAGGGGLFRDANGNFHHGYAFKCGVCSAIKAEMWSIFHGLSLARRLGYTKLIVESDSAAACSLLTGPEESVPAVFHLVESCKRLVDAGGWEVKFCHIRRQANRAADSLANWSLMLLNTYADFCLAPSCV